MIARLLSFCLCLLVFTACITTKPAQGGAKPGTVPPPSSTSQSGSGTQPNTGGGTKPTVPAAPVGQTDTTDKGESGVANKRYELAVLLPMYLNKFDNAADSIFSKSNFSTDFLAGLQLATEQLQSEGANLNFTIYDSQASSDFTTLLNKPEIKRADVIIGPAERDNINTAAQWAKSNDKTVVSMFAAVGEISPATPNFVQLNPSLEMHCSAITRWVLANHTSAQVVLVAREADSESARFPYFQKALKRYSGAATAAPFRELVVNDASPGLTATNLGAYLSSSQVTIFVVPSWQEAFVSALLRKIDLEAKGKRVIVVGMPQWTEFNNFDYSYFNKLNVMLCTSMFIDPTSEEWQLFQSDFFARFQKSPNKDAVNGYDIGLYVGRMVRKYGPKFQYKADVQTLRGLQSSYKLTPRPVAGLTTGSEGPSNVLKYENESLFLLEIKDGQLRSSGREK